MVPDLDLTVVSVGRVAGFPNYNPEHPLQLVRAGTAFTLLPASLVTRKVKTKLRFHLVNCKQNPLFNFWSFSGVLN